MNNFLINFETNVMLSGMVQIQAGNKTEAKIIAKKLIEKNLNLEDCLIELGTENNMNENGTKIIRYEDGSVEIIPAPFKLSAEDVESIFGEEEEEDDDDDDDDSDSDSDEEDDDDSDDDDEEDDEEGDDDDEDDDDDSDDDDDEEEEEEEEEEITPESLAEMDFEELEDVCEDKELDVDPDDYDEDEVEKLRKDVAKALGIKLPAPKKSKKGKK